MNSYPYQLEAWSLLKSLVLTYVYGNKICYRKKLAYIRLLIPNTLINMHIPKQQ